MIGILFVVCCLSLLCLFGLILSVLAFDLEERRWHGRVVFLSATSAVASVALIAILGVLQ